MLKFKICRYLFAMLLTLCQTNDANKNVIKKVPFTIDDIIFAKLSYNPNDNINKVWINNTSFYYYQQSVLWLHDMSNLKSTPILTDLFYNNRVIISPCPNGNYILFSNENQNINGYISLYNFSIHDIHKKSKKSFLNNTLIPVALWTPKNYAIIYAHENNIYYYDVKNDKHRQLTKNVENDKIFNGLTDWMYGDQFTSSQYGLWTSPEGNYLAFATINDSEVLEYEFSNVNYRNRKLSKIKNPLPGTPNPQIELKLINLLDDDSVSKTLHIPKDVVGSEPFINFVTWFDSETLVATWMSRGQNKSQIISYSLNGSYHYLLSQNKSNGWLLTFNYQVFNFKNNFFILEPQMIVENKKHQNSFNHLIRYEINNNVLSNKVDLTPGRIWVSEILLINKINEVVYFLANLVDEPSKTHLYEVNLRNNSKPICISCNIKFRNGNVCSYVSSVSFSWDYTHYALTCSTPFNVHTMTFFDYNHSPISFRWYIIDIKFLTRRLFPKIMNKQFLLNGQKFNVRIYLPDNFDDSKKYPMILYVYGGPEYQQITDEFKIDFESYMTTNRKITYAIIDGPSTNSRGTAGMYKMYRNLGHYEVIEQISAMNEIKNHLKWIDSNKIGVWGWSYGGYTTLKILAKDYKNIFKCGIAVAPVVDWIYHVSRYTESFMNLPTKDNLENYKSSSVLNDVKKLRNKKFMLMHGTEDENVHFMHSAILNESLTKENITFEMVTYPGENHDLDNVLYDVYQKMDVFWSKCFGYVI